MLLHEAAEATEVGADGWDAHDGTLSRRVPPRLIVRGEHAHVTAPHEVLVVQAEERVGRVEELGVEDHLWVG